jgi:hypothetical protein
MLSYGVVFKRKKMTISRIIKLFILSCKLYKLGAWRGGSHLPDKSVPRDKA